MTNNNMTSNHADFDKIKYTDLRAYCSKNKVAIYPGMSRPAIVKTLIDLGHSAEKVHLLTQNDKQS